MSLCRKFKWCSAPQCPLDKASLDSPYFSGEPVCLWLLEYSKKESRSELASAIGGIPIEVIAEAYETLFASNGTLKSRLNRAAGTSSRLKFADRKSNVEEVRSTEGEHNA